MGLDVGAEFMESLQGRPLTRLSAGAGLLEGVAPALLCGGEVPCSEGFTRLSSDDIGIDAILFFSPSFLSNLIQQVIREQTFPKALTWIRCSVRCFEMKHSSFG